MSSSYHRVDRRRQTPSSAPSRSNSWGHWVPLAITLTVATAGVATWVWNERRRDHEYQDDRPPGGPGGYAPQPGFSNDPSGPFGPGTNNASYASYPPSDPNQGAYRSAPTEEGIVSRVSGALRRTPSPQQFIDGASKRVVAGMAAASAAVGGALSSIREEDRKDYEDHSRWSEEADSGYRKDDGVQLRDGESSSKQQSSRSRKRTVAIILSAKTDSVTEHDGSYHQEDASMLSHLNEVLDKRTRLFVLIYDPTLSDANVGPSQDQSLSSSFSNIGKDDVTAPGTEQSTAIKSGQDSAKYTALYNQAHNLVEKDSMIMPFSTPTGYIHLLRQLTPETVYLQAALAGMDGEHLSQIRSWVGQTVLVVGDDSGHGGLVDSEDEHAEGRVQKWWLNNAQVGLGKGVEVVDGMRLSEDFRRRVTGHD